MIKFQKNDVGHGDAIWTAKLGQHEDGNILIAKSDMWGIQQNVYHVNLIDKDLKPIGPFKSLKDAKEAIKKAIFGDSRPSR